MKTISFFKENWLKNWLDNQKQKKEEKRERKRVEEKIEDQIDRFYYYSKIGNHKDAISSIRKANTLAKTINKEITDYIPVEELKKTILDSYKKYNELLINIFINDFKNENSGYYSKITDLRFATKLSKKIGKSLTDYIDREEIRENMLKAYEKREENLIKHEIDDFKSKKYSKALRIYSIRKAYEKAKKINKELTDFISLEEIRNTILNADHDELEAQFNYLLKRFKENKFDSYYIKINDFERIKKLASELNKEWKEYICQEEAEKILNQSKTETFDNAIRFSIDRFKSEYMLYPYSIKEIRSANKYCKEINKSLTDYISREEIRDIILKKRKEWNALIGDV
ncbi:MAG: hypothetical protein QXS41_00935 [Candidatus Woesearchaeota archaeon]